MGEPRRARHRLGAAEVARVVREPRTDGLVGARLQPGRREQPRQPRAATHRVDDQVGRELVAAVGADADHPRGAVGALRQEACDAGAAADGQPRLGVRDPGERLLEHRAADLQRAERSSPGRGARSVIVGGM